MSFRCALVVALVSSGSRGKYLSVTVSNDTKRRWQRWLACPSLRGRHYPPGAESLASLYVYRSVEYFAFALHERHERRVFALALSKLFPSNILSPGGRATRLDARARARARSLVIWFTLFIIIWFSLSRAHTHTRSMSVVPSDGSASCRSNPTSFWGSWASTTVTPSNTSTSRTTGRTSGAQKSPLSPTKDPYITAKEI